MDDHELVRRGLRELFETVEGVEIIGEAATVAEALEGIESVRPDVAVLDIRLPDGDGVELCREIRSRHPEIGCLMLTAHADEVALLNSIMAGATGYLLKLSSGDELIEAVRAAASGRSLLDPATSTSVMNLVRSSPGQAEVQLSGQQQRVLDLIVEGLTNREIAERMDLAEKTVKNYVSTVLDKLKVRSRTQAAVYGARRLDGTGNGGGAS